MPTYNTIVDRVGAAGNIPREITEQIIGDISTQSTAMALGRQVPTTTRDSRIPVLSSVPDAYFVTGDTGLKQTTTATFDSQPLVAEEIACLVMIPDAVIADSAFDLWNAIRPMISRAFARRIDRAVLFGIESPASWPAGMFQAAMAAGNSVPAGTDRVASMLGAAALLAEREYNATAAAVSQGWQYRVSAQRSDAFTGSPVGSGMAGPLMVAGLPIRTDPVYWDRTAADVIVADWSNVLLGMRQDLTFDFSNSAVIQDDSGAIVNNAWQRDSTCMRAVMRVGYHLAKPANQSGVQGTPVAVVTPASPSS